MKEALDPNYGGVEIDAMKKVIKFSFIILT
jgi:hypothetical protein